MERVLVTGGAGFIGSNFVRLMLAESEAKVIVLDKLTYAGSLENLPPAESEPRLEFIRADIADGEAMRALFVRHHPTAVVNFAAESHVDRSIDAPDAFIRTNINGTFELLAAARAYLDEHRDSAGRFRFLYVSTDEVYGSLGADGWFTETTPYAPNSPYAASKASADHLVRAYHNTYDLPVMITNCCNNYGPYQFPEKLIPLMVLNAVEAKPLPIYGDGRHVRDWLFVEDHCAGILAVLEKGRIGEHYNIGARTEKPNIEVVDTICNILEELVPAASNEELAAKEVKGYRDLKNHVEDRAGHDRRYAIDPTKIETELGWKPRHDFEAGIRKTVQWYLDNGEWCRKVQESGRYNRQRLGLAT